MSLSKQMRQLSTMIPKFDWSAYMIMLIKVLTILDYGIRLSNAK